MLRMREISSKGLGSWVKGREYQKAAEVWLEYSRICMSRKNGRSVQVFGALVLNIKVNGVESLLGVVWVKR